MVVRRHKRAEYLHSDIEVGHHTAQTPIFQLVASVTAQQCVVNKIELPDHPPSRTAVFWPAAAVRSVPNQCARFTTIAQQGTSMSTRRTSTACSVVLNLRRSVPLELSFPLIVVGLRPSVRPRL